MLAGRLLERVHTGEAGGDEFGDALGQRLERSGRVGFRGGDDEGHLALEMVTRLDLGEDHGERPSEKLLVHLGNLTREHGPAVAENIEGVLQSSLDAMGSFVQDKRDVLSGESLQGPLTLPRLRRKEAAKAVLAGGQSGGGQGGRDRRGTRDRRHDDVGLDGGAYQQVAGIGGQRHAGVRDQCDGLAGLKSAQDFRDALSLVVVVATQQRAFGNAEKFEEFAGATGILAGDEVDLAKDSLSTPGDVLQIA